MNNIDPSLARGLKNQFFRDLMSDVNATTLEWMKISKNKKILSPKYFFKNYFNEVTRVFGNKLLAIYKNNDNKKPLICICTVEDVNREYKVWNENGISSILISISTKPFDINVISFGFIVGEHAIKRIYERLFTYSDLANEDVRVKNVLSQFELAPFWGMFWSARAVNYFEYSDSDFIDTIIPSKDGLLLGVIHRTSVYRNDIRTFIGVSDFSVNQKSLYDAMIIASSNIGSDIFAFLIMDQIARSSNFKKYANGYFENLRLVEGLIDSMS